LDYVGRFLGRKHAALQLDCAWHHRPRNISEEKKEVVTDISPKKNQAALTDATLTNFNRADILKTQSVVRNFMLIGEGLSVGV
jgi:hypothetical protein